MMPRSTNRKAPTTLTTILAVAAVMIVAQPTLGLATSEIVACGNPKRERWFFFSSQRSQILATTVTDAEGNTRHYDFYDAVVIDTEELPNAYTDPKSEQVAVVYRQMRIDYGESGLWELFEFEPDAGLALKKHTDLSGNVTTWQYSDPLATGGPEAVTFYHFGTVGGTPLYSDPTQMSQEGLVTTYTYGPRRMMKTIEDPENRETTYTIDAAGNRTGETVREGGGPVERQTDFTYGAPGAFLLGKRVSGATGPGGVADLVTTYVPDPTGRVASETTGYVTREYVWDPAGNKREETQFDELGAELTTVYDYDERHRLIEVLYPVTTDPLLAGESTAVEHAVKRVYTYGASDTESLIEDGATLQSWRTDYDAFRRVAARVNSSTGYFRGYEYNGVGSLKKETGPDPSLETEHDYDVLQRRIVTTVTDLGGGPAPRLLGLAPG